MPNEQRSTEFVRLPVGSLRGDAAFRRVHGKGKHGRAGLLNLRWLSQRKAEVTLGIVVSKKVGNAVVRNRLRRQVREIVRRLDWPKAQIMVVMQPEAAGKSFQELWQALVLAANRAGLGVAGLGLASLTSSALPDKMAGL